MTSSGFIDFAQTFYAELGRDNTKSWWDAHKKDYDTRLKAPALALIEALTAPLSELYGEPVKGKLFRPHRDVRFSSDKRPYKEHIHMLWAIEAGGRQDPALYLGVAPGYIRVGGGVRGMDKAVLEDWRKFVDLDAKRVGKVVNEVEALGFTFSEPDLVRTPRGFAADHPLERLLRMKSVIVMKDLPKTDDLEAGLMAEFRNVKPAIDLLVSVSCA